MVQDVEAGHVAYGAINPRDYRFVMSLARRYNAIVFWHRDRGSIGGPSAMPLAPRARTPRLAISCRRRAPLDQPHGGRQRLREGGSDVIDHCATAGHRR
jgi:hypothetical protein